MINSVYVQRLAYSQERKDRIQKSEVRSQNKIVSYKDKLNLLEEYDVLCSRKMSGNIYREGTIHCAPTGKKI